MSRRPEDILRRYHVWEPKTDIDDYQWKMRLLQSHWREKNGLQLRKRGAELPMPEAEQTLDNYLTDGIREVVRQELKRSDPTQRKLFGKPRIYNHLLSSQPLCFNLFGELIRDLDLASRVLCDMSRGRVAKVTGLEFEWSPGRGDERYTKDNSAFDVYVKYCNSAGGRGFLGIEVKYHENLRDYKNNYRDRYDEVAADMGCFKQDHLEKLRRGGRLQQIWRDHLLAGSHFKEEGFDDACFVFLYPNANTACASAVEEYRECLSNSHTFDAWILDDLVDCLKNHTDAAWVRLFHDRYLDFSRLPQ